MDNKKIVIVLLAVAIAALVPVLKARNASGDFVTVAADDFAAVIDSADVQLVDVRTLSEYAESHLKGAVLMDVKADSFMVGVRKNLDRGRTVAVYCRSGRRSADAARLLSSDGFRVINLSGGILEWTAGGRATVK